MSVSSLLNGERAEPGEVGATLRTARESAGYSIADVAERMCLSPHNIEDLEAERFERFPVAVFLRGYLTSYARLLGIAPEPLLEAYERQGFGPPQLYSAGTVQERARGSELTVTITTLAVIAALIVLAVLWWREQWGETGGTPAPGPVAERPAEPGPAPGGEEGPEEPDSTSTAASGPAGDASAPGPAGGEIPDSAEGSALPGSPTSETRTDSPLAAAEAPAGGSVPSGESAVPGTVPGGEDGPGATIADSGESTPTSPEMIPSSPSEETAVAPTEVAASPPLSETGSTTGRTGDAAPVSLVIRVREDCWLMVRDVDDRLIYRDLAAAGEVLGLSGAPPIRIVAGYARGIEVEYNGESFDLSPFIEQDTGTARFRLGS